MKRIIITLALLLGLSLSAQEKKAYQLENGVVKIEQFYATGEIQQISFYLEGQAFGTWKKYDELGNVTMKAKMENGRPVKITHFQNGNVIVIDRKKD